MQGVKISDVNQDSNMFLGLGIRIRSLFVRILILLTSKKRKVNL